MSNERRNVIEHSRESSRKQAQYARQDRIEDLIDRCSAALGEGRREGYLAVARTLRDDLIPLIREHTDLRFSEYDRKIPPNPLWDWVALTSFLDAPDAYVDRLSRESSNGIRSLTMNVRGYADEDTAARLTVEKTLGCVTAIAEYEGIVMEDYASRVDAVGFSIKLGEHKQREDLDFGDPVRAVTEQVGYLKTLHSGGTGTGKSTAAERELEDFYRRNFEDGRDIKAIDPVGFGEGENWLYDVPQQQSSLRRIREDMDLEASFETIEGYDPKIEILVPLTPGLESQRLPYDLERGEFSVRPFTIPASSLSKALLTTLIGSRLSNQQRQTILDVYEVVDQTIDDWSLRDLVDEILDRDELSTKHKRDAISPLRALQNEGYVRTKDDPHTLDWSRIFNETETITVFSQALLTSELSQFTVAAYLIDSIWRERQTQAHYPDLVLMLRELWEIVPHKNRQVDDDRAAKLQSFLGDILTRLVRKNRHISAHIVSDTQKPKDTESGVRSMFNRYVIFNADRETVRSIYSWTSNNDWKAFYKRITAKVGEAGIVGEIEPARTRSWVEYIAPVSYTPPSFHHLADGDRSGWRARTLYLENEELRPTEWDTSIPDELAIPPPRELDETLEDDGPDPGELARAEARMLYRQGGLSQRDVREEIRNNPETDEPYSISTVQGWLDDVEKGSAAEDG